ncbi:hypothetical protein BU16DRAFT_556198 [Lophium mytilinum]|uniref:Myb-like domain-containing protein n=1 Tax=Lophium mytilinum TaxID=390894 RepID=A0A6A6RB92_9PEZI|nr:hypothetical protein BU16DRAFT_556198 [Lophium mytilinum]
MPRGVYERKTKGNKTAGPATATGPKVQNNLLKSYQTPPLTSYQTTHETSSTAAAVTSGEDQITTSPDTSPPTHFPLVPRREIPAQRTAEDLTPSERHSRNMSLYPDLYTAAEKAFDQNLKTNKQKLTVRRYLRMRRRNRAPVHHDPYETLSSDESDAETSWHRKKLRIQKKRKALPPVAAVASTPDPVAAVQTEVVPALDPASSSLSSPPESDSDAKPVVAVAAPEIVAKAPVRRGMRWTVEERQLIIDIFNEHAGEPQFTIAEMMRVWVARMKGHRTVEAVGLEYQKYKAWYVKRELPPPEIFGRLKRVPKGVAKKADMEVAEEGGVEGGADQMEE